MDGFDLTAARLIRLRQDIDALLPNHDPQTRQDIFRLLSMGTREGLDLFPRFRDMIAHRSKLPPPDDRAGSAGYDGLEIEALPEQPRATLWPYRPKREPDELLSSWLWRIARGLGAPPKRFALDAIGARLADVDREIGDAAIDRLAFLSGQSREHLLRGTMRPDVAAGPNDQRGGVQQRLLRHGDLVLNRNRGGRGRAVPMIQYCPVCLSEPGAYLRRGWRFSLEVACFNDGCFLLDACWKCGALVDPLSHTMPATEFVCVKCSAPLAKAPSLHLPGTVQEQEAIYARLHRLAAEATDDFSWREYQYVAELSSSALRGTNPTDAATRHHAVMLAAWDLLWPPPASPMPPPRATKWRLKAEARRTAEAARIAKHRNQGASQGPRLGA